MQEQQNAWPRRNMWPVIKPLVAKLSRPARYLNHEWGAQVKQDADFHFVMAYPDTYELGQPNQAVRILVNVVNATPHLAAERGYLPAADMCDALRKHHIPLASIETCAPIIDFDAVGITLPHELCLTNVLEFLDLSGIPLYAKDRNEDCPLVLGGGPCAFNPEPFAAFFDVISIGEGEESMPELLCLIREMRMQGKSREDIVLACAQVQGTYVPCAYDVTDAQTAARTGMCVAPKAEDATSVPQVVVKRVFNGFAESPAWEPCVVPYAEIVHDRLNVEILRGCTRGCRFCQAGMMYRPVRERSADNIVNGVIEGLKQTGYDEVSLTSLSSTDHSQIGEILTRLNEACAGTGTRVSIPSQRMDAMGVQMAQLVAGQKKGGLTFAPEAGTQRLRNVINKNRTEENILDAVRASMAAGWRRCKLYFMIGLPTETDEDVRGIAELAERVLACAREAVGKDGRGSVSLSLSVGVFVPKAQTPFQWEGQISTEEARRRISLIKHSLHSRAIDLRYHSAETSFVEAVMSRGGREVSAWVVEAWRRGARFDAWSDLFNLQAWQDATACCDIDPAALAEATFPLDAPLPWNHISTGVDLQYLKDERRRAYAEACTPDCTFEGCTACGACWQLPSDIMIAAAGGRKKEEQ